MHFKLGELSALMKGVDGDFSLIEIEQIHGGAQKVVYKLRGTNSETYILYVWDPSKNYVLMSRQVTETGYEEAELSYGAERFAYNTAFLEQLGVRVPHIFYLDRTQTHYPFDFAIVEDVGSCDLSHYIQTHPEKKQVVLEDLNLMLKKMHETTSDHYGQLFHAGQLMNQTQTCEHLILNESLKDLDELSKRDPGISQNKNKLIHVLYNLYNPIHPRQKYGVIHHELGPDHIRVTDSGEPVLIDIEGAKHFDIEYEHAFLEFRFGENYSYIKNDHLDPDRLLFYKLHLHISCSIGPLKIIENGFPQAEVMKEIADYNIKATLNFLNSNG